MRLLRSTDREAHRPRFRWRRAATHGLPLLFATSCVVPYLQGDGSTGANSDGTGGMGGDVNDGSSSGGAQGQTGGASVGGSGTGGAPDSGGAVGAGGGNAGTGGGEPSSGGGGSGGGPIGPSIYDFVENPGADCSVGPMPTEESLLAENQLPDPFTKMDGTPITDKSEWVCRREEILQQSYAFIYGEKPMPPKSAVTGTVSETAISVTVNDNGETASFSATVTLPSSGAPPYPAVITLSDISFRTEFTSRGVAVININANSIALEDMNTAPVPNVDTGAFYDIYGAAHEAGYLVAWAWGVSRVIDLIEANPGTFNPAKLAVSGCSRFGKGAFVAGALDNRIALTMPFEAGLGGAVALRLIEQLDPSSREWGYFGVSYQPWFSPEKLSPFATASDAAGDDTNRLPIDMHEMMALIAPRGLAIADNPGFVDLNLRSAWVTANVGKMIFEALGVGDHFSYMGASGTLCEGARYAALVDVGIDKFLLGNDSGSSGTITTDLASPPNHLDHIDWDPPTLSGAL